METNQKSCVQAIKLTKAIEKRVAFATIHIGDIVIRGVAVWRSPEGKLRVYLPSHKLGSGFEETICLPDELRSRVEVDVAAAYQEAATGTAEAEISPPDSTCNVRKPAGTRRSRLTEPQAPS